MNTEDTNKILDWIKEEREKINTLETIVNTKEVEPICKNCKYWNHSFKVENNISDCDNISYSGSEDSAHIEATAHDDSGLEVFFMTNRTFGCTLFESK
jgi:hypothetical protein